VSTPDNEPDWKAIALYLADCHAATAQHEGSMSRTSKSSKDRFISICEKAAGMIRNQDNMRHLASQESVLARLDSAVNALKEK